MDPIVVLTTMGMVTGRTRFASTCSTTYYEPFDVARRFATLDLMTNGRAAWNVVTSVNDGEAHNMGRDQHLEHDPRYDRADEFMDVVLGHWDSWEDGSIIIDKKSGRFAEASALLVDEQRAVFPGIPVAEHDFHELVGAVIAQVMFEVLIASHVVRFAVVHGGDHIPGGTAVGHQIEGGEAARHVERLVIGGRTGRGEPELLGDHAHRGQDHDRIHFHAADAIFDGVGVIVAVAVRHRQPIVEERQVEFSGFEDPGDLLIVIRRHRIVARLRMPPRTRQVGAVLRLQEADHCHLPCHAGLPGPARC